LARRRQNVAARGGASHDAPRTGFRLRALSLWTALRPGPSVGDCNLRPGSSQVFTAMPGDTTDGRDSSGEERRRRWAWHGSEDGWRPGRWGSSSWLTSFCSAASQRKPMAPETAKVLSVNVGGVRKFDYHGRPAQSAIWKSPVSGRVAARGVNLAGDRQADLEAHGGFDKAVYAYSVEDQRWWEREIGR